MIYHHPGAGRPALRCRAQIISDIPIASGGGGIDTRFAAICMVVSAAAPQSRVSLYHMRLFYSPDHSNRDRLPARTRKP